MSVELVEYRDWANRVVFEVPIPIITGRPKVRHSDTPTHETVGHIIKPKVDELINFGEKQGISSEELIDIVFQRNAKKTQEDC